MISVIVPAFNASATIRLCLDSLCDQTLDAGQYEILLDWWYARLRELEASIPDSARLITREYEDLYVAAKDRKPAKRIGMTKRELALNWIFTGLYTAFAAGIVLSLLV